MERKRIVIIAKAIYPSTLARATRASELAKELARQGHEVTLYAELGDFDYATYETENSLAVKNIGRLLFSTFNSDGVIKKTTFASPPRIVLSRLLGKVFGRLLEFPDIELMFRMRRIVEAERDADLLISVAMPHPIHWGCALARSRNRRAFPKIWIADCGDPYMGNQVTSKLPLFYFKWLEKWFCREADCLTVPIEGAIKGYYQEFWGKISVIPQGVRFKTVCTGAGHSKNAIPTFAYAGSFYKGVRDPSAFLEYLSTVNSDFKMILFVSSDYLVASYVKRLGKRIEIRGFIPREQLLVMLAQMDFLVNFENGTSVQSPSKLIDYAVVNKPVLAIQQDTLPVETINEFLKGDYRNQYRIENPDQYRIENVAGKFLSLYDRCLWKYV